MFGTKDVFGYIECAACGSLSATFDLSSEAMSRYYPKDYYSFSRRAADHSNGFFSTERDRHALGMPTVAGRLMSQLKPLWTGDALRHLRLKRDWRILDVGCGSGSILSRLASAGFTDLTGVDPFLERDTVTAEGVELRKCSIRNVVGQFDAVMFHHSLEHSPDPRSDLLAASHVLSSGGLIFVSLPTCSSEAYDTYGGDWVQIDAPRHYFLPSRKGMDVLAERAGLTVAETIDNSTAFQFVASEAYRRGIPQQEMRPKAIFTKKELAGFNQRADAANRANRGDQAVFYLRR